MENLQIKNIKLSGLNYVIKSAATKFALGKKQKFPKMG